MKTQLHRLLLMTTTALVATTLGIAALSERAPDAIRLLGDVALRPDFPASELERVRQSALRSLAVARSQPQTAANAALAAAYYGADSPYGRLLPTDEQVRRCAAFKATVCLRDPYERGERAHLNLGHTFGHALEVASGYSIAHGHAVALGLLAALRLSGLDGEAETVEGVLSPTRVRVDRDAAWAALQRDKKAVDGQLRLVLLDAPGRPRVTSEIEPSRALAALDDLIA